MNQAQPHGIINQSTIIIAAVSIIIVFVTGIVSNKIQNPCPQPPVSLSNDWNYADLRIIDPAEQENPALDLVAAYFRTTCDQLQLRMDFLDYYPGHRSEIYISFISTASKPAVEDVQSYIRINLENQYISEINFQLPPGNRESQVVSQEIMVYFDTFLDAIFISLPLEGFTPKTYPNKILVLSKSIQYPTKTDILGPIEISGAPPPPIPILLAFKDTFQSNTPAQALRSWDGAHTGPDSSRHGLRHLLNAAYRYNFPIILLDFNTPINFAALEYLNTFDWVMSLKNRGILLFMRSDDLCNGYAHLPDDTVRTGASNSGLSPQIVKMLLENMPYEGQTLRVFPLCISFQNSYWGDPESVNPTLLYISQHPWMRPVSQGDLTVRFGETSSVPILLQETSPQLERLIYYAFRDLQEIPTNQLTELARQEIASIQQAGRQMFFQIDVETYNQIGHLIKAAEWANTPGSISTCAHDIDWDEEAECILASDRIFTSFELSGGYISSMYYRGPNGIHQIIGHTYQLQSSIIDKAGNLPATGLLGDPVNDPLQYEYKIYPDGLELISADMAMRKNFHLRDDTFEMTITNSSENQDFLIPIILDPWVMSYTDWADLYSLENNGNNWQLSLEGLIHLQVHPASNVTVNSFITPRTLIGDSEDPNQDYSWGYFLPFPLTLIQFHTSESNEHEAKLELTFSTK